MNDIQKLVQLNQKKQASVKDIREADSVKCGKSSNDTIQRAMQLRPPMNAQDTADARKEARDLSLTMAPNIDLDPFSGDNSSVRLQNSSSDAGLSKRQTATKQRDEHLPNAVHSLPLKSLRNYGLLLPDSPRCSQGEQYRQIKRTLMHKIRDELPGYNSQASIMVTSAVSGEGKTFTALNLALSFSQEKERSVLFIDADVLKCSASRLLGFSGDTPGLTDLLAGGISNPLDIVHPTQYDNLRVVPAGTTHPNTTELLSTRRMRDLLETFCQHDSEPVIILDAPPLLQTTEACAIADHVGQIAFVISSASTGRSNVKTALAKLGKDMRIGIVFNKLRHASNDVRYNYSYD